MEDYNLPREIFAHGPSPDEFIEEAIIVKEKTDVVVDMMPGSIQDGFGRFRRAAKGGGGRLPNRNG